MLDDMLDYLETINSRPVWQPIPPEVRANFQQPLPQYSTDLSEVHKVFMQEVLPYAVGNAHPGFMGWVHGGGTPVGMLAEMLAAGLNANLGGRYQMPVEVERQVLQWVRELFKFPASASGARQGWRQVNCGLQPTLLPVRMVALRRLWIWPASASTRCVLSR